MVGLNTNRAEGSGDTCATSDMTEARIAFVSAVEEVQQRLFGLLLQITQSRDLADDLSQEVFLKAWKGWHQFDREKEVWPWVVTIAKRVIRDDRRRKKAKKRDSGGVNRSDPSYRYNGTRKGSASMTEAHPDDSAPESWEQASKKEERELLRKAIEELPEAQRDVMRLRCESQLSSKEIADVLGKTLSAIEALAHRAKAQLKSTLRRHGITMESTQIDLEKEDQRNE